MPELRHSDIFHEVYELCHDLLADINQQLMYFRASVYKNETADLIREQIKSLQSLADLVPDEAMQEPFLDYEAELANMLMVIPGECSFSARVARLLQRVRESLEALKDAYWQAERAGTVKPASFRENIRKNRQKILAICQPGSRRWNFFESL